MVCASRDGDGSQQPTYSSSHPRSVLPGVVEVQEQPAGPDQQSDLHGEYTVRLCCCTTATAAVARAHQPGCPPADHCVLLHRSGPSRTSPSWRTRRIHPSLRSARTSGERGREHVTTCQTTKPYNVGCCKLKLIRPLQLLQDAGCCQHTHHCQHTHMHCSGQTRMCACVYTHICMCADACMHAHVYVCAGACCCAPRGSKPAMTRCQCSWTPQRQPGCQIT